MEIEDLYLRVYVRYIIYIFKRCIYIDIFLYEDFKKDIKYLFCNVNCDIYLIINIKRLFYGKSNR